MMLSALDCSLCHVCALSWRGFVCFDCFDCFEQVNLLHNKQALQEVSKVKGTERADAMFSYFGPYVGLYFAWLDFYIK